MRRVFLVRRQSPDWKALSSDFRSKRVITPERYIPTSPIPGFPSKAEDCIASWNNAVKIDFFTCRMILRDISMQNNSLGANIRFFNFCDIKEIIEEKKLGEFALFFYDDDDLFDPNISEIMGDIKTNADVVVFPLIRFNKDLFTFVKGGADLIVGKCQSFHFRYQTNNYAILSENVSPERLLMMKDHVEASSFADRISLTDELSTKIVSATVKSPCSASLLERVAYDPNEREAELNGFIQRARELEVPKNLHWFGAAIKRSALLFEIVKSGGSYDDLVIAGLLDP